MNPVPGKASAPLVVAALRHASLRVDVDPLTAEVVRDPHGVGLSPSDAAALEHALRIGEAWQARVLAVVAGPADADSTLREAAAVGAEVLRVAWPPPGVERRGAAADMADDGRALAAALAAAVRTVAEPALVLCGDRSADRGTGTVPAFLAAALDSAQALGLVSLKPDAGSAGLLAERRLDRGRRERLRVPLPAVCSVEAAGVRLRRAGMQDTLAAAEPAVPVHVPALAATAGPPLLVGPPARPRPRTRVVAAPAGEQARERLLALTGALVARTPPTLLGPMAAAEAADALLDYLVRHEYLAARENGAMH